MIWLEHQILLPDMRRSHIAVLYYHHPLVHQPGFYKKKSLCEFASMPDNDPAARYLRDFEKQFPEVAYFYDIRFESTHDCVV